jgi:hypothetical protein
VTYYHFLRILLTTFIDSVAAQSTSDIAGALNVSTPVATTPAAAIPNAATAIVPVTTPTAAATNVAGPHTPSGGRWYTVTRGRVPGVYKGWCVVCSNIGMHSTVIFLFLGTRFTRTCLA